MTNVVIASAARTAVGTFGGGFADVPAHDLGSKVLEAVVERAGIDKAEVSETILGQVLTAGQGQNPARQAHINAGLPIESAAWGINQVCGSGLRAVALGCQHIQLGDAKIIAAGGQENMSMAPHVQNLRKPHKMGDLKFIDSMIKRRALGRVQRLPHGQYGRERRREMADQPRAAGRVRGEVAQQRGEGARRGPLPGRDRRLHLLDPEGRRDRRQGRAHPRGRDGRRHGQAAPGLRQGRIGDRGKRQRKSTTAPRRCC